jgi:hypothetical protein
MSTNYSSEYVQWIEKLILRQDFITSDRFRLSAKEYSLNYILRDFFYKSGNFRGEYTKSFFLNISRGIGRTTLIGHSDFTTSYRELAFLRLKGFKKVLGTNLRNISDYSTSLPLGLTNPAHESHLHRLFGNTNHIKQAHETSNFPSNSVGLLYANFSIKNNEHVRRPLAVQIKNLRHIDFQETQLTENGRIRYLQKLRSAAGVICPAGNGIDTHRIWETLYMGGIPIVKESKFLPQVLKNLPVLVIQSWDEIRQPEKIFSALNALRTNKYHFHFLSFSYWNQYLSSLESF